MGLIRLVYQNRQVCASRSSSHIFVCKILLCGAINFSVCDLVSRKVLTAHRDLFAPSSAVNTRRYKSKCPTGICVHKIVHRIWLYRNSFCKYPSKDRGLWLLENRCFPTYDTFDVYLRTRTSRCCDILCCCCFFSVSVVQCGRTRTTTPKDCACRNGRFY